MSKKNGKDYLYLIWKSETTRRQYTVGQLTKNGQYEFQYTKEIDEALEVGFVPLVAFPDLKKTYYNEKLFPAFSSRLPDRKRRDINKILEKYSLDEYDAYLLLKRSGAKLPIDNLLFVDPVLDLDSSFRRNFLIAGPRHYLGCEGEYCEKSLKITKGDEVFLEKESNNTADDNAIKIYSGEKELLGYVPRYYSKEFTKIINEGRSIRAYVSSVNQNRRCDECIYVTIEVGSQLEK